MAVHGNSLWGTLYGSITSSSPLNLGKDRGKRQKKIKIKSMCANILSVKKNNHVSR